MLSIRRITLLALSLVALLAATTASASAATFAPAGHGFQAASGPISFAFDQGAPFIGPVTCTSSSTNGTLANPASHLAPTAPPTFSACTTGSPGITATITSSGVWNMSAVNTSRVDLRGSSTMDIKMYGGSMCRMVFQTSPLGEAGDWSNATRKITLTDVPLAYQVLTYGPLCPGPQWTYSGFATVNGVYTVTNTTSPGTPITVQP